MKLNSCAVCLAQAPHSMSWWMCKEHKHCVRMHAQLHDELVTTLINVAQAGSAITINSLDKFITMQRLMDTVAQL